MKIELVFLAIGLGALALFISILTIYLRFFRRSRIKFYTDENIRFLSDPHQDKDIRLNLSIINRGAKMGKVTDLLLVLDNKYVLAPVDSTLSFSKGFVPIIVGGYSNEVCEVEFMFLPNLPPQLKSQTPFDKQDYKQGSHTYILKARLNDRNTWTTVLKRTFKGYVTTSFKNRRNKLFKRFHRSLVTDTWLEKKILELFDQIRDFFS